MQEVRDISGIFSIWNSLADLARDTNTEYYTVTKWWQRRRIPPESWDVVIKAAKKKRITLTTDQLHRLNKPRAVAQSRRQ